MKIDIRDKIKIGSKVLYKNKEYVVINKEYQCSGCSLQIDLVKIVDSRCLPYAKVIRLYDEQIEDLIIVK